MRRLNISFIISLLFALVASAPAFAQGGQTFTDADVDYTFELPSPTWRVIAKPDNLHPSAELIYGDRLDGYLQIRKETIEAGMSLSELATRDREQKLHFRPGYVDGKEESFAGRLTAITISYEYTSAGKPMLGRIYYLQADPRTVYTLHFTGLRDKLQRIRSQTDFIARSFRLK